MKKFLMAVIENTQPISQKMLFMSFISGYGLAILIYTFYRPQVHHLVDTLISSL
jgi:hypothetical protein